MLRCGRQGMDTGTELSVTSGFGAIEPRDKAAVLMANGARHNEAAARFADRCPDPMEEPQ
jgi:hypothetical protein